ncbi:ParB/RepB/Spo0J family partition protein [Gloeothece verrucosa]|uniref:ParB-like partition protein n=1 Tax=Gloeothece verrucosa (strain PCC 7822) TaxID=497965 RepID=E0UME7_GLOV7|nr:ParB/RepB/Spo0J family partition protein [Gloeothece verrucosa]ADN18127.1 parB-like partition protein [Gloeothece verrucosa PCC 7822]
MNLQLNNVALFLNHSPEVEETSVQPVSLPIDAIQTRPSQPRRYFSPQAHQELVDSIRQHGILQPILVRPLDGGTYELVAGERRYRAAIDAGLTNIPVLIKQLSDGEASELTLIENLQRENLNPLEEAEGILELLSIALEKPISDVPKILYRMQNEAVGKVTQNVLSSEEANKIKEVFRRVGTISWESFIPSRLSLLSLPNDILAALREGKIEYTKAVALAKIKDDNSRRDFLLRAIEEKWTLSQIKEKIKSLSTKEEETINPQQRIKSFAAKLKKSKSLADQKVWKKIEGYLSKIESLIED